MAILSFEHLLEQAEALIEAPPAGPPRQVNLRRAISAAYYALFHYILTMAADEFVGTTKRTTPRYSLVYRSVDHSSLRKLCLDAVKASMPEKLGKFAPKSGLGPNIQAFAGTALELQQKRHLADYDPSYRVKTSDAELAIAASRSAIARFGKATTVRRKAFLTLLLFPPR